MSNRYKLLMIFGIALVVVVLTVSTSFALWTISKTQKGDNVIIGDCLSFSMDSQNDGITLEKTWPLIDFEGMQLEGYKFTVKNNCDKPMDYRIELNNLVESPQNYLNDEFVAVLLDYGYKYKLSELENLENTDQSIRAKKTLAYDTVMGGATNSHTLRLWVDESATNEAQNKSFLSKVSISAGQGIEKYYTPEECFTFNSSTKTITAFDETCYETYGTDLVIPYQMHVDGKDEPVAVTKIGTNSFKGTSGLKPSPITSVEFPRSVTHINTAAFRFSTNLEKVIFKDGLDTIAGAAFMNADNYPGKLSFVMLPETVRVIQQAFSFNSLEQIIIPDSATTLSSSFRNNKIKNVKIGSKLTAIGANLFSDNEIKELEIPNNIKTIGAQAFLRNPIKEIVIPDTVTTINDMAFQDNNLESVVIGNSVKTIAQQAFALNPIKSLILGSSLTTIEAKAFSNNVENTTKPNYLTEVVIPSSVTTIEYSAFETMTQGTIIRVQNAEANTNFIDGWNGQATVIYEPIN